MTKDLGSGWSPVYRVVRRIPEGSVATYGQVAVLAGMPRAARQVGWALSALTPEDDVPWQRVINARGEVSSRGAREYGDLQRALLESEGVEFDARGRVDLGLFGWQPRVRRGPMPEIEPKKKATKKPALKREKKSEKRSAKKPAKKPKTNSQPRSSGRAASRETPKRAERAERARAVQTKTLKTGQPGRAGAKR